MLNNYKYQIDVLQERYTAEYQSKSKEHMYQRKCFQIRITDTRNI